MKNVLNFVCPTDCLERRIDTSLVGTHFFYSSLGNSISFSRSCILRLKKFIEENQIGDINFTLSIDNLFIKNALLQEGLYIKSLDGFNKQIQYNHAATESMWMDVDKDYLLLSQYLNHKISELRSGFKKYEGSTVSIGAQIYVRQEQQFKNVYTALLNHQYFSAN